MAAFRIGPSEIVGQGLFAIDPLEKDALAFMVEPHINCQPFHFINHTCAPNCRLHRAAIFAARHIEPGEELTIDYRTIRFPIKALEFQCQCGDLLCDGPIKAGHGR